jgi:DNA repair protein RadC
VAAPLPVLKPKVIIRVLDHVVIGKGRFVSFVDEGYW